MSDALRPLTERLMSACVAGCSCLTKTPDFQYHEPLCHYRLHRECLSVLSAAPEPCAGWISVEDRLPKDGDRVIYAFNGRSYQGAYEGCNNELGLPCFSGASGWLTGDVMFWMPWPEAPQSTRLTKEEKQ